MTFPGLERRRFPRIPLTDDARALDANGGELGRIAKISGSGVLIHCSSDSVAEHLMDTGELRIIIVEPRSQTSSSVDVTVRYREGRNVGFEFAEVFEPAALEAQIR